MSDSSLPPALLSRLRSDELSAASDLASSPLSSALSSSRSLATRSLLAHTPEAIQTTVSVLRSGSDKDRLAAATLILSKSPATSSDLSTSEASLPPALLSTLASALSSLASAFSNLTEPNLTESNLIKSKPSSPSSSPSSSSSPDALRANSSNVIDAVVSISPSQEDPVKSDPLPILNLPSVNSNAEMTSSGLVRKPKSSSSKKKGAKK